MWPYGPRTFITTTPWAVYGECQEAGTGICNFYLPYVQILGQDGLKLIEMVKAALQPWEPRRLKVEAAMEP